MIYANDYVRSNDNDTIEAAIAAKDADGIVVIPRHAASVLFQNLQKAGA